jgi:hypothetical protein
MSIVSLLADKKSKIPTDVQNPDAWTLGHPSVRSAAIAGSNFQRKLRNCLLFPLGCTHAIKRLPPVAVIRRQPIPY